MESFLNSIVSILGKNHCKKIILDDINEECDFVGASFGQPNSLNRPDLQAVIYPKRINIADYFLDWEGVKFFNNPRVLFCECLAFKVWDHMDLK